MSPFYGQPVIRIFPFDRKEKRVSRVGKYKQTARETAKQILRIPG